MSNGRLVSIISLYNWDDTLFDDIAQYLPTTVTDPTISITPVPVDLETLIGNIMFACGELSIIYNSPVTLKFYLKLWAKKNAGVWQKLFDTLFYNYDPLFARVREYHLTRSNTLNRTTTDAETENNTYNRTEHDDVLENVTGNDSNLNESTNTRTLNTTETTSGSENGTQTNYKQAYNDIGSTWSSDTKTETTDSTSGTRADTGTIGDAGRVEDTGQHSELTTADNTKQIADVAAKTLSRNGTLTDAGQLADIITEKITGQRAYQELIDLQRKLAMFNLYDFIIDQFKHEFCVMIY